jgi:hypothetical protein
MTYTSLASNLQHMKCTHKSQFEKQAIFLAQTYAAREGGCLKCAFENHFSITGCLFKIVFLDPKAQDPANAP